MKGYSFIKADILESRHSEQIVRLKDKKKFKLRIILGIILKS